MAQASESVEGQTESAEQATEEAVEVIDLAAQIDATDWIPDVLLPYWQMLEDWPLLAALVLVVSFYVIAWLTRVLFVYGLGRLAERSSSNIDNLLIEHLKKPVFTAAFSLGLILAIQVAQLDFGATVLINLLASGIIVSWMLAGLKLSTDLVRVMVHSPKFSLVEPRTLPLFDLVTKLVILLFASYSLLLVWGINPVGWLASRGSLVLQWGLRPRIR